jgi:hypothetical protein
LASIIFTAQSEEHHGDEHDDHGTWVTFETIGIMMLWTQLFLYLSVFSTTNYLTRMIKEVFFRMQIFMMIYIIGHFAFAETFYFISKSSKTEH